MNHQEFGVIGLGRFGISVARELARSGSTVLVVDQDKAKVQEISSEFEQALALDATSEEALRSSGILEFPTIVVCIGADFESNILVTNLLKELGCKRVISKALSQRQRDILLKTGADAVVLPEFEGGQRLAQALLGKDAQLSITLPAGLATVSIPCKNDWKNKTLMEIGLCGQITVLSIRQNGTGPGQQLINSQLMPPSGYKVQAGDHLLLVGLESAIQNYI